MGFTAFGSDVNVDKIEVPDIDMEPLYKRLDDIKAAVVGQTVLFDPTIEVAPAQLVAEVDLHPIQKELEAIRVAIQEYKAPEQPITVNAIAGVVRFPELNGLRLGLYMLLGLVALGMMNSIILVLHILGLM